VANVDIRCRGRQALPSLGWVCFHSGPADHISRVLARGPDFTKDFLRLPALRNGLANDLAELNRLNFSRASPDLIVACLATCRSRVRAVRRYRSDVRARRWIQVEISMARVLAFFGADAPVRQLSYAIYGQLVEMVADLDDFLARRPFEE